MTSFKFDKSRNIYNNKIYYLEKNVIKKTISLSLDIYNSNIIRFAGIINIENLKSNLKERFIFYFDQTKLYLKFKEFSAVRQFEANKLTIFNINNILIDYNSINYDKIFTSTKNFTELFNYIEKYNKNLIFA